MAGLAVRKIVLPLSSLAWPEFLPPYTLKDQ